MKTKLTLSIDSNLINRAKLFASRNGTSISKMVEEYLNRLTSPHNSNVPDVKNLSGLLRDKVPTDMDWKAIKAEYLTKKYGLTK